MSLENFTRSYIAAILWAETDDNDTPLDHNYGPDDFAPDALEAINRDCKAFYSANLALIESDNVQPGYHGDDCPYSHAGIDFWLTRMGHGAGFWDGDWPRHGDALTCAARAFGEGWPYVGDDGKLYV